MLTDESVYCLSAIQYNAPNGQWGRDRANETTKGLHGKLPDFHLDRFAVTSHTDQTWLGGTDSLQGV